MMQEELIAYSLNCTYEVLMSNPKFRSSLTLGGAYGLYMGLSQRDVDLSGFTRLTKDLDFSIYGGHCISQEDYEWFRSALVSRLGFGYLVDFSGMVVRDGSVTFKFTVMSGSLSTRRLKVDFSFDEGIKCHDVTPLEQMLARKIALSARVSDRRVKDKFDVLFTLFSLFPQGVRKSCILGLLSDYNERFELSSYWVSDEDFASRVLRSARGFKPDFVVGSISNEESLHMVRAFLLGLSNEALHGDMVFRYGGWYVG